MDKKNNEKEMYERLIKIFETQFEEEQEQKEQEQEKQK